MRIINAQKHKNYFSDRAVGVGSVWGAMASTFFGKKCKKRRDEHPPGKGNIPKYLYGNPTIW